MINLIEKTANVIIKAWKTKPAFVQKLNKKKKVTNIDIYVDSYYKRYLPKFPVISEEKKEEKIPANCWIIDPVDGTSELLQERKDYVSMVTLVRNYKPILAFIYIPEAKILYFAVKNRGAYKVFVEKKKKIKLPYKKNWNKAVISNSEPEETTKELEKRGYIVTRVGSALKFCAVAEGSAYMYLRTIPCKRWDTLAGELLCEESGCEMEFYKLVAIKYMFKANNGGFVICRRFK